MLFITNEIFIENIYFESWLIFAESMSQKHSMAHHQMEISKCEKNYIFLSMNEQSIKLLNTNETKIAKFTENSSYR